MKKYLLYIVIFLIGALAGMWAHRQYHFRDATNMSQNDTIVRLDTIRYSKLELIGKNYNLDVPKIGSPELVYIPTHSLDTIYRDNIQYVTLPRQFYFTETEDAQIWHSGIDSTIDSLNVFRKNATITQTIQPVTKRNALSVGIGANYATIPSFPVQLEYAYYIKPWFNIYGYAEYELLRKQWGIGMGTKIEISW